MGLKKFLIKKEEERRPSRRRRSPFSKMPQPEALVMIDQTMATPWQWIREAWAFHPSGMGVECDRALLLNMAGLRAPVSAKTYRIWDEGKCMHERWTGYFERAGLLIAADKKIENAALLISGKIDVVLNNDEPVGEMKSINTDRFSFLPPPQDSDSNLMVLFQGGQRFPAVQWVIYAAEAGAERGFILYEDKDKQVPLWFSVMMNHDLRGEIYGRMERLLSLVQAHVIPVVMEDEAECRSCDLEPVCRNLLPLEDHPFKKVGLEELTGV